ncbi:MAG: hypothetical protein JO051_06225 [Acidobacteriaceae bacterium]|nr:hypothetical protein [Acidobacteriaceae bacterium]
MPNKLNQTVIAVRRELRWPVIVALLAICVLFLSLPERLTFGPNWLLPAGVVLLLVPTAVSHRIGRHTLNFGFGVSVLTLITFGLASSLGLLIAGLPGKRQPPEALLRSAVALWSGNVLLFACWYWRLDAGGPHSREINASHSRAAFLFPQLSLPEGSKLADPTWKPKFVDYLFLAFNTSTAFSPTDVPVLGRWAKALMMVQSSISLATIAILAARAINIL